MAVPSDVLRAARRRQKLDSVLTTQRPWNVEPRVDGLTRRSCALPRSALLLAIAWRPGKLRLALLVCASGSNVCRSSGVSTGFAEPWHLLRGVCQMYPSYVLIIMRGCIAELRRWPLEGRRPLDVGGGIGVISKELAGTGVASATIVEASPAYLEVARREAGS